MSLQLRDRNTQLVHELGHVGRIAHGEGHVTSCVVSAVWRVESVGIGTIWFIRQGIPTARLIDQHADHHVLLEVLPGPAQGVVTALPIGVVGSETHEGKHAQGPKNRS